MTSAARRRTRPGKLTPPANVHFGSSWAATVLGFSPALRRLIKVDDCMFPHPSLNVHDERAPYWLAFNLTESTMAAERHFVYVLRSVWRRVAACACVIGKENGTSAQPAFWHRCPYPTVGLPVGSGEGLATKPSNSLIRLTVAVLTAGGAQAAPGRQHLKSAGPGQRPCMSRSGRRSL